MHLLSRLPAQEEAGVEGPYNRNEMADEIGSQLATYKSLC